MRDACNLLKRLWSRLVRNALGFTLKFLAFRIGLINQSAVGHLALDTEVNYLENIKKQKRKRHIWYLLGDTTNYTLSEFWTTKLSASDNPLMLKIYSAIQPLPRFQSLILNRELGAGDASILDKYGPTFEFTKYQNIKARELLERLRVDFSKPLVLFCLRDNAYYASKGDMHNINIHSHRNVDVSEYTDSIKLLVSRGFLVVRMGRQVEKRIEINNKDFVDLPFAKELDVQSIGFESRELIELALFQRCKFVISTGLGMDALATLFRKRIYLTDYYSVYNLYSSKLFPMFLPKGYLKKNENRVLAPTEVFNGLFLKAQTAPEFDAHEVKLLNCSKNQLVDFMNDVVDLEVLGKTPTSSQISIEHSEHLSKLGFLGKPIPRLSRHWLNH